MVNFLFGRHRVRDNFYHCVSVVFVLSNVAWLGDLISGDTCAAVGGFLFTVDYIAMMYDPHPDKPGTWFKSHFHRAFEIDEDEVD